MEEVTDESRTIDHQNEGLDKVNGSAGQEIDAPENGGSSIVERSDLTQSDVAHLKSKLSDRERPSEEVDVSQNPIHASLPSRVESSDLQDDPAMETSPLRSEQPSVEESAESVKESDPNATPIDEGEPSAASVSQIERDGSSDLPSDVCLEKSPLPRDATDSVSSESNRDDRIEPMSVDSDHNSVVNSKETSNDVLSSSPVPNLEESSQNLEPMDVSSPVSSVPTHDERSTNVNISNEPESPVESDEESKEGDLHQESQVMDTHEAKSQDADLLETKSHYVDLQRTESQDRDLPSTEAHDLGLQVAESQGMDVQETESQGADSNRAESHSADLHEAESQGTDSNVAESHGADLHEAESEGTESHGADLREAESEGTESHGADLHEAKSQGTDSNVAESHGADLHEVESEGTDSNVAESHGADVHEVESQSADLQETDSQGADLQEAESQGADLQEAESQGADLQEAESQGADLLEPKSPCVDSLEAESRGVSLQDAKSGDVESQDPKLNETRLQGESQSVESSEAKSEDVEISDSELQDVELQEAGSRDVNPLETESDDVELQEVESQDSKSEEPKALDDKLPENLPQDAELEDSELQDAELQDSNLQESESLDNASHEADIIDTASNKSVQDNLEDRSFDNNDVEMQSDSSIHQDENSSEPAEKTRFLSVDQDAVPDDADTEAKVANENVEDPFSAEPEETSDAKQTEGPEDSSEETAVQDSAEDTFCAVPEDSAEGKETEDPKDSSKDKEGTADDAEDPFSAVPDGSAEAKQTEESKDSSEEKDVTEENEETPVLAESKEPIEESSEVIGSKPDEPAKSEVSEKAAESETVEESEKSLEMEGAVDEAEESSEARKTSGEGDAIAVELPEDSLGSKEVSKESEDDSKPAEVVENSENAVAKEGEGAESRKDATSTEVTPDDKAKKSPKDPKTADESLAVAEKPELMEVDELTEAPKKAQLDKAVKKPPEPVKRPGRKAASKTDEDIVVVDDEDLPLTVKLEQLKKAEAKPEPKKPGRPKKNAVVKGAEAENICIIPDLPEIGSVSSLATPQKAGRSAPAPSAPSGRTQRRAAKTAGLKLRRMMAAEVEPMPGKDAVQPVEKSVSSANFVRKCAECRKRLIVTDLTLYWETMEYCDTVCLGAYLSKLGKFCANCRGDVQSSSLGKYCVRFGTDINQFCCSQCLEEFKKGLKVCSYCQKDISSGPEGFLAPVGDKGQFKDFCSQECMVLYETISNNTAEPLETQKCTVCSNENVVQVRVRYNNKITKLCSDVCFAAFKFANSIECEKCNMCRKYYHDGSNYVIFYEEELHTFCSKTCMNVYILGKRRIILCSTCKVKKYNFDMIKRVLSSGAVIMACSLNCLNSYQSAKNLAVASLSRCDTCKATRTPQYYLTMSDGSVRNFCSNPCVSNYQSKHRGGDVHPVGSARKASSFKKQDANLPVISTVTSLATNGPNSNSHPHEGKSSRKQGVVQQILVRPPPPKSVSNKIIQCRPAHNTKGVSCKPFMTTKSTQTEEEKPKQVLVPIPVPIFVPLPCAMYKLPVPFAMPIPLPIPVPIFIPTTRNSTKGIMKEMKRIQKKIPQDPFEAELLMMAAMVAEEKKPEETSSSEDDDIDDAGDVPAADPSLHDDSEEEDEPAAAAATTAVATVSTGNHSPAVSTKSSAPHHLEDLPDIEDTLKPATIVPTERPPSEQSRDIEPPSPPVARKARKRTSNSGLSGENLGVKRVRRSQDHQDTSPSPASPPGEIIRPDANMNLKYTYGVNAWRQWVLTKNIELEKVATKNNRKPILFKTDLLKLTPDELNYALCLFLKEVKKPSGGEYAPDTLFYFCLGIQHYLFENGRVDNLFTDPFYETFTDRLDEVGIKFASMYDGTRQIVTRIEEEHLWESKQLGAHSPHVLLNTLMFFNTKHFNLATVDEHMQLSFAHIMKHWKRNSGGAAAPVSSKSSQANRNVLLRFYPPQSALEGNSRKKKMYEQKENEQNPLRCPVKLYEFYLSKCPESVKTRNDVFYLLPERSCVPDSPVWYSTMAYDKKSLNKMITRIKMVKEVNIALLTL